MPCARSGRIYGKHPERPQADLSASAVHPGTRGPSGVAPERCAGGVPYLVRAIFDLRHGPPVARSLGHLPRRRRCARILSLRHGDAGGVPAAGGSGACNRAARRHGGGLQADAAWHRSRRPACLAIPDGGVAAAPAGRLLALADRPVRYLLARPERSRPGAGPLSRPAGLEGAARPGMRLVGGRRGVGQAQHGARGAAVVHLPGPQSRATGAALADRPGGGRRLRRSGPALCAVRCGQRHAVHQP